MSNERCFEACARGGYVVVLACAYCKAFHSWWRACCKMARGVATFMRMNPSPPCPNISPVEGEVGVVYKEVDELIVGESQLSAVEPHEE